MDRVIVVGAGPVGIVTALALHRHGVAVTVLEKEPAPVKDQRAASLHPTTLTMLDELGVTEVILPRGLISHTYQYRDRETGELIAEFDLRDLADLFAHPFVLQYEQYKLTRDISAVFAGRSDFDVRFGWSVSSVQPQDGSVLVEAVGPDGAQQLRAPYVVGADGGRSTVRKGAGIDFEGFTYGEQFIKIATPFDFSEPHPDYAYRNYFSDPNEWCNLFKVRGEDDTGLWRAIFPTAPDETDSLSPERIEARMQRFFPKPDRYEIAYADIYTVNQRVAATFRSDRILLAGDAAHVNNPIGGMGMNGGIHDAINLAEKLADVLHGNADDSVLDRYSRQRRHTAINYVQQQTIANKKMLEERERDRRAKHHATMRRTSEDPHTARQFMRRASLLESLETAAEVV